MKQIHHGGGLVTGNLQINKRFPGSEKKKKNADDQRKHVIKKRAYPGKGIKQKLDGKGTKQMEG